ncbi:DUF2493 domain-containing protein [Burkholderia lata]|uniref:YspA cpYpsA-related SLOG domain-containing protein n=1 Tax=Burkholderia lata (strain ATCC 17760 / DSM 23089 / LMG 22485 / NCIMB 9086 / R18194 / 383) TaxID=482957 RepID=A0A6P2GVZ9_BURL3|nr:DUF2493 domain-containing protein [Burkholderia lata]VWB07532.1 hypothetical protein BLA6863_00173 [Burkholderia lata]
MTTTIEFRRWNGRRKYVFCFWEDGELKIFKDAEVAGRWAERQGFKATFVDGEIKVIVCGGREYQDRERVFSVLDSIHAETPITVLIQGGARGADDMAFQWGLRSKGSGMELITVHAEWKKHGRRAGPIRNAQMLEENPHLVVAFPGGRGTADMVRQAKAAGVPVMEVE